MGLRQTVAPVIDPVTLAELKRQARRTDQYEDATLLEYIREATSEAERVTSRQFLQATYALTLDDWPGPDQPVYLERPPLVSVSSIVYLRDSDGAAVTMDSADYVVDAYADPGKVSPAWGTTWPSARRQTGSIVITYLAGYGTTAAQVPAMIRGAIRQMAAAKVEYREAIVPGAMMATPHGAEAALENYRNHFDYRVNDYRHRRRGLSAECWP